MNAADLPDEALFEAALNCRTPAERAAYLDRVCAGQPELRRQLEILLAAHDQSGAFLETPATPIDPALKLDLPGEEAPGTVIGCYKLQEKIGEGGAAPSPETSALAPKGISSPPGTSLLSRFSWPLTTGPGGPPRDPSWTPSPPGGSW